MKKEVDRICAELRLWNADVFVRGEAGMIDVLESFLTCPLAIKAEAKYSEASERLGVDIEIAAYGGPCEDDPRDMGDPKPMRPLHICSNCEGSFRTVLRCAGCAKVRYCGKVCQAAHWKSGHKKQCKETKKKGK